MDAVLEGSTVRIKLNKSEVRKIKAARGLLAIIEGTNGVSPTSDKSVVGGIDALLKGCVNGQS